MHVKKKRKHMVAKHFQFFQTREQRKDFFPAWLYLVTLFNCTQHNHIVTGKWSKRYGLKFFEKEHCSARCRRCPNNCNPSSTLQLTTNSRDSTLN